MKKMKISKQTKKILSIVLVCVSLILVVGLVANIAKNANEDYKKVHLSYDVGAIDKSTGEQIEHDCALYTKDLIECTGADLYAAFDSDIKYTVHFYDENEVWLSSQDNDGLNMKIHDMPADAAGIRVVIYPQNDENDKISLFEKGTYSRQLTVKITTVEPKTEE